MGWFWNDETAQADKHTTVESTPPSHPPPPPATQISQKPPPPPEDEFAALLRELEAPPPAQTPKSVSEIVERKVTTKSIQIPSPATSSAFSTPLNEREADEQAPLQDKPTLPFDEEILPTTLSCRQAFDAAFYCQSFGGQFNALYRYGSIRSCSPLWSEFWFCMKTRSLSGEGKENMIREHMKHKNAKYKTGPSSEDIWKGRDEMMEDGAFSVEFEEFKGTGEEWNEMERRRREGRAGTLGS